MQIEIQADKIYIKGDLTFNTIEKVLKESLTFFPKGNWHVDLSQVDQVDSAALSLFCEWKRWATQKQITLTFSAVHSKLKNLMDMCGIKDLLLYEKIS